MAALGTALPNVIGVVLMISYGVTYFDKSNYYEEFDRKKWISSEEKPLKMVRGIVKDGLLNGLTEEEVIKMLGKGEKGIPRQYSNT